MKECKASGMMGKICSKKEGVCLVLDDLNQPSRVEGLPTREEIYIKYAGCICLNQVLEKLDELEKEGFG